MKKLFIILFLGLISLTVFSQERTVTRPVKKNATYYKYNGVTADTLVSTNQDTIDVIFQVHVNDRIEKIEVKTRFDMLTTADTTVAVSVFGRNFTDDTYTSMIASTVSSVVITDNVVQVLTGAYTESQSLATYNQTIAAHNIGVDGMSITNAAFSVPFVNVAAGTGDTLEFPVQTLTVPVDTFRVPAYVIANGTQTTTVTPVDYSFRYIRVRYIIQGNDSVGTGIKIDEIELIVKL